MKPSKTRLVFLFVTENLEGHLINNPVIISWRYCDILISTLYIMCRYCDILIFTPFITLQACPDYGRLCRRPLWWHPHHWQVHFSTLPPIISLFLSLKNITDYYKSDRFSPDFTVTLKSHRILNSSNGFFTRFVLTAFHCVTDSDESDTKPCDHSDGGEEKHLFKSKKIILS